MPDLLVIGAINAIKDSGLSVPDNISVVGFDDIDMGQSDQAALTTMHARKIRIGEIATKLIFQQLKKIRNYHIKVSIPTVLQKRSYFLYLVKRSKSSSPWGRRRG